MARCKECLHSGLCQDMHRFGIVDLPYNADRAVCDHFKDKADVVEVKHGKWNEDEYPFCNVCMECGLVIDRTCIKYNSGKLNYCPNCGAKMDGGAK